MKIKPKATIALHTLGCKLNQAESELLTWQFNQAGYTLVSPEAKADIYILNSCTVTHIADRKSRHWLRLARRINPKALVIATGCYAERTPQELAQIEGVDLVIGNKEKARLLELTKKLCPIEPSHLMGQLVSDGARRVRTLIKVQDGCNNFCAYCIVPRVRGQEYCLPVAEIVTEVKARVAAGYQEVVLTGTKVGSYRHDGVTLKQLVEHILAETDVGRLRLSSLQPQEISPELIHLWQEKRLCRHFHLALQSGSDNILKQMRRDYSLADYHKAISFIREAVPDIAITTDIMVGFPGESDKEFEESYRFCQEAGFANIHVFPYSPRPGTIAAPLPRQVDEKAKKQRSRQMLELARRSAQAFCQQFLGRTMMVLWEKEITSESGLYSGLTDNYIRVFTQSDKPLTNRLLPVRLVRLWERGVWGESLK